MITHRLAWDKWYNSKFTEQYFNDTNKRFLSLKTIEIKFNQMLLQNAEPNYRIIYRVQGMSCLNQFNTFLTQVFVTDFNRNDYRNIAENSNIYPQMMFNMRTFSCNYVS